MHCPYLERFDLYHVRGDLLPDDIVAALQGLQDDVAGFSDSEVRAEIGRQLARPLDEVFSGGNAVRGSIHCA